MIARATLALMLACPAAAALASPAGADADHRKQSGPIPTALNGKRDRAANQARRLRQFSTAPSQTAGRAPDDGLAYDTPRDAQGRPLRHGAERSQVGLAQMGLASWYGGRQWQGRLTSSGTRFDENGMTAAHATLPLGSQARVRLVDSQRDVVVTITDRVGTRLRVIDLSRAAASKLGILSRGVAQVAVEPL